MKYTEGDRVEVRCAVTAPWFEGTVVGDDGEHYVVKLDVPQLLSILHGRGRKRDMKADRVSVKKHLETIGIGHMHLRLKNTKTFKAK